MSHTQGEWIFVASQEYQFPSVLIPSSFRDKPDQLVINAGGWPLDVHDSNARLIAAAPPLLAALESAWQWMEGQADAQSKGGHATFDLMMLREQRDIARAAIDKAKGEA